VPKSPAITNPVALAMVREHLSGLRGFNPMLEAEALLARTIQSVCVSVEHAEAVLTSFDSECPTPKEIKDTAWAIRDKFERPVDQIKEWEKEYGPPDPQWSKDLLRAVNKPGTKEAVDWNKERIIAMRHTVYYTEGAGQHNLSADAKAFWAEERIFYETRHKEEFDAIREGREPEAPRKPGPVPEKRITDEMIRAAEPWQGSRCSVCGGSGRVGDDYCTCPWGVDLERSESGSSEPGSSGSVPGAA